LSPKLRHRNSRRSSQKADRKNGQIGVFRSICVAKNRNTNPFVVQKNATYFRFGLQKTASQIEGFSQATSRKIYGAEKCNVNPL
jgi:hypothetical protein